MGGFGGRSAAGGGLVERMDGELGCALLRSGSRVEADHKNGRGGGQSPASYQRATLPPALAAIPVDASATGLNILYLFIRGD